MLGWLSWLAPSLVVKVTPSGYGEKRRAPTPTTVSFVWATKYYNATLPHWLFSWDFLLRFALDRFRLDTAGKSSRTFYRRSDEKKSCSLFVLSWGVWDCRSAVSTCWLEPSLGMFSNILKMPPMHWKTVVTPTASLPVPQSSKTVTKAVWKLAVRGQRREWDLP